MSTKFDRKVAEIYTLTNQIRLELNHIRHRQQPNYFDPHAATQKKHFGNIYRPTGLLPPDNSQPLRAESKKHYSTRSHQNIGLSSEKKHYAKTQSGSVILQMPVKQRKSSYLNFSSRRSLSPQPPTQTSMMGVGRDRDRERPRSGIRIHPEQYVFKRGLI